jgi:HEAT repeat protein
MPFFGPPNIEKLKTKGNIAGLIKALSYPESTDVRIGAANALGQVGNSLAADVLVDVLVIDFGDNTIYLADALVKIGPPAVDTLVIALRNPGNAVQVLRQTKVPFDIEQWVSSLDERAKRRSQKLQRKINSTVESLVIALEEQQISRIGVLGVQENKWMRDELIQDKVANTLVEFGFAAVEPVMGILKDHNDCARMKAAEILGRIGDPHAVESLEVALGDVKLTVRAKAAEALGQIGDPHAIEFLQVALKDRSFWVLRETVKALMKLKWKPGDESQCATVAVVQIYLEGMITKEKIHKIASKYGVSAVDALVAAFEDSSYGIAQDVNNAAYVAEALGQIGDARAVEPFIAALVFRGQFDFDKTWNHALRSNVARALGRIGDKRALEPLLTALKDSNVLGIQSAAAEGLGQLGDARAVEPLVTALSNLGGVREAIPALEKILERAAADATLEDLYQVTALQDRFQFDEWVICQSDTVTIDCSRIKQLARQELIRRGLEA